MRVLHRAPLIGKHDAQRQPRVRRGYEIARPEPRESVRVAEARHQDLPAAAPAIAVPTITIGSDFDGAAADGSSYRDKFTGRYDHRVFEGIGHNVPQEAPVPFAQAVVDADHL